MTDRQRLPIRRPNQTFELVHNRTPFAITIGYDPATKEAREVFTHGAKVGSMMDAILDDSCILLSVALQNGIKASSLAGSMGYHGVDKEPSSIVGRLVNLLAGQEEK